LKENSGSGAALDRCPKPAMSADDVPVGDSIADNGRRAVVRGARGGGAGAAGKTKGGGLGGWGDVLRESSSRESGPTRRSMVASAKPPTVARVGISGPQARAIVGTGRAAADRAMVGRRVSGRARSASSGRLMVDGVQVARRARLSRWSSWPMSLSCC
jgi:hypothetical protein